MGKLDKLSGKLVNHKHKGTDLVDATVTEAKLASAVAAKLNQGKVAGIITTTLPSTGIITDKVYEFAGVNGGTVTGGTIKDTNGSTITTLQNGDSVWHDTATGFWYRIPFQSLSNYYTKTENKALADTYMSNKELIESTNGENYEILVPTYTNGVVSSATVKWRDTATGVLTLTRDSNGLVSSYTITHVLAGESTRTITQATVTRDSEGKVTNKPALTIS